MFKRQRLKHAAFFFTLAGSTSPITKRDYNSYLKNERRTEKMKKVFVILFVVIMVFCATAVAETGKDFDNVDDCIETLGIYKRYELPKAELEELMQSGDFDGYVIRIREMLELAEDEDLMVIRLAGDTGYYGFAYKLDEKNLEMDDREILRVIRIEFV
jgi:hypothetical protein